MIANRKFIGALAGVLTVLCLVGYFLYAIDIDKIQDMIFFYVFQIRDLQRATDLITGQLIFYGPEVTGGGNLPGPFYYFLLAAALAVKAHWTSAWFLLLLLVSVSLACGWRLFRTQISLVSALLWLGLFSLSAYSLRIMLSFLNVSYLLPFAVLIFICIYRTYDTTNENDRRKYFLANHLLLGLAVQLHLSILSLWIALLFLHLFARPLRLNKVDRKTFSWGLVFFITPCLPYITWLILSKFGIEVGQGIPSIGSTERAVSSLALVAGYTQSFTLSTILQTILVRTLETVPLPIFVLAFLLHQWRKDSAAESTFNPALRALTVCLLVSVVPFAYWFFATIGQRYGIPFFVGACFLTILLHHDLAKHPTLLSKYNNLCFWGLMALLIFLGARFPQEISPAFFLKTALLIGLPTTALYLGRKTIPQLKGATIISLVLTLAIFKTQMVVAKAGDWNPNPILLPRLSHWRLIWTTIYSQTGWSYQEAIRRIYFLNHHLEQDASIGYAEAVKDLSPPKNATPPDGYFVTISENYQKIKTRHLVDWLLDQNIQHDVRAALERGDIELGGWIGAGITIVPYYVKNTALVPQHFHNYGLGYAADPDEDLLDGATEAGQALALSKEKFIFKWNECPSKQSLCATGSLVSLGKDQSQRTTIEVKSFGRTISQISPWINPDWTQAWINPFIEVECGPLKERLLLASSIGYRRENASVPNVLLLWGNNSFIGPHTRTYSPPCTSAITAITVGRESSSVETLYSVKALSGKSLRLSIE